MTYEQLSPFKKKLFWAYVVLGWWEAALAVVILINAIAALINVTLAR